MNRVEANSRGSLRWARAGAVGLFLLATAAGLAVAQDEERKLPGIYAMNADGGNLRKLVRLDGKWNGSPSISPDGKTLLFDACNNANFSEAHVYTMPLDGTADNITDLGAGNTPTWSADGKRIAYYIHDDEPEQTEPGVWIMNADGSEKLWMCYGNSPRWFPDGKHLLVVNYDNDMGQMLYLYDIEKNESEALLTGRRDQLAGAACSPDGKRAAIIERNGPNSRLIILPLTGDRKERVRLTADIGYRPNWTADGKYVLCWINDEDKTKRLHRVEIDSDKAPEKLANQEAGTLNGDASNSSDGKQIVFQSNR